MRLRRAFSWLIFMYFFGTTSGFTKNNPFSLVFTESSFDIIQMPPCKELSFQHDFTVSFKVSFADINRWSMLLCYDTFGGMELSYTGDNSYSPYSIMLSADGTTEKKIFSYSWRPQNNIWYWIVCTRNANTYKVFVDGKLLGKTESNISYPDYCEHPLRFGNWLKTGYNYKGYNFVGSMNEFSLWNVSVADSIMQILNNNNLTGKEKGLLIYYPIDSFDLIKTNMYIRNYSTVGNLFDGVKVRTKDEVLVRHQNEMIKELNNQKFRNTIIIIALVCVLFLMLIYGSYRRFKIKQKSKIQEELIIEKNKREKAILDAEMEERNRIAKDIHDELGAGLSKIRILSELLPTKGNAEQLKALQSIKDASAGLSGSLKDLIWILNPTELDLQSLIADIRAYASDYLEELNLDLKVTIPDKVLQQEISSIFYRNTFMVVKEALQNIAKHSNAQLVEITIEINSGLRIMIGDNGNGYGKDVKLGNGIKNMKSRIDKLKGHFHIESSLGSGTKIELEVPLIEIPQK